MLNNLLLIDLKRPKIYSSFFNNTPFCRFLKKNILKIYVNIMDNYQIEQLKKE